LKILEYKREIANMGNRERIIESTIELMNKSGSSVGTTQLINHLGISPGNLYYHFRNREQILEEVLRRLQDDLDEVLILRPEAPFDAKRLAQCFTGGARVLWKYRFFFSSSRELVMNTSSLAEPYRAFFERGISQVDEVLAQALQVAPGALQLDTPERKVLAENMWVLWTSWPQYAEVTAGQRTAKKDIRRSLLQLIFLIKPYIAQPFFAEVLRLCHQES
jgi:AcrR family transcriptional regulator